MPKRAKARATPESTRERVCTPLATKIPLTRKHNQPKAGRIEPCSSAKIKKKRNIKGANHHHFEGLNNLSISPSPAVVLSFPRSPQHTGTSVSEKPLEAHRSIIASSYVYAHIEGRSELGVHPGTPRVIGPGYCLISS